MRPHRRFAPFLAFFLVVSGLASVAVGPAFALPSQVATSFDGGAGTPTALAVSRDGLLVAVSGSSGVAVWDLRARQEGAQLASVCTDSGAEDLVFVESGTMGDRFYVACSGGGLHYLTIDDSTIPVTLNESEKISLNLGSGNAVALVYAPGDDGVYAVIQDASLYSIDRIPLTTSSGDSELLNLALTGTAQAASVSSTGSPLVVTRSDGFVSNFERSGSSYSIPSTLPFAALGVLSDVVVSSDLASILVSDDGNDAVWAITIGTNIALEWGSGFSSPSSLALGTADGAPVLWVAESGGRVTAWDSGQTLLADVATDASGLSDLAVVPSDDGDVFVVAADGTLLALHDRPVIETLSVEPETVTAGESFVLSFSVDRDCSWDLRSEGSEDPESGISLGSGEVEPEEIASIELDAASLEAEGENRLFLFVSAEGETGFDSVRVVLDTPPEELEGLSVSAGDERLSVSWLAGSETDIALYEFFLSDTEFDEDDLPEFTVVGDEESTSYPLELAAGDPEEVQSHSIEWLTNGTTYWVAVRAIDEGGLVGPLSEVGSAVPAATCGAAECAEDPGCSCLVASSRGSGPALFVLLLFLSLGLRLSRRQGGA